MFRGVNPHFFDSAHTTFQCATLIARKLSVQIRKTIFVIKNLFPLNLRHFSIASYLKRQKSTSVCFHGLLFPRISYWVILRPVLTQNTGLFDFLKNKACCETYWVKCADQLTGLYILYEWSNFLKNQKCRHRKFWITPDLVSHKTNCQKISR